jgi:methionine aminotransferase
MFRKGLGQTQFKMLPGEGTYFQCVDISGLSVPEKNLGESKFCEWLTTEIGVAAIPMSAFYGNSFDQNVIRFCFAKQDETLQTALSRLSKL